MKGSQLLQKLEVVVTHAQVEVFARGGRDRDRQATAGFGDPSEFTGSAPVIVNVFHDLGGGARLAVEGHEDQTPGIERGESRRDHQQDEGGAGE